MEKKGTMVTKTVFVSLDRCVVIQKPDMKKLSNQNARCCRGTGWRYPVVQNIWSRDRLFVQHRHLINDTSMWHVFACGVSGRKYCFASSDVLRLTPEARNLGPSQCCCEAFQHCEHHLACSWLGSSTRSPLGSNDIHSTTAGCYHLKQNHTTLLQKLPTATTL